MEKEKKYLRITFKPESRHKMIDFEVKYPHIETLIQILIEGKRDLDGKIPKHWILKE